METTFCLFLSIEKQITKVKDLQKKCRENKDQQRSTKQDTHSPSSDIFIDFLSAIEIILKMAEGLSAHEEICVVDEENNVIGSAERYIMVLFTIFQ